MGLFDSIIWQYLFYIQGDPEPCSYLANKLAKKNKLSEKEALELFPKYNIEKEIWNLLSEKAKLDLIKLGFRPQVLNEEYFRLKNKCK